MQTVHFESAENLNHNLTQASELFPKLALPKIERANLRDWDLFSHSLIDIPYQTDPPTLTGPDEIVVCNWSEATTEYFDLFNRYLFKAIPANKDKISAHNLAHLNRGTFIYVPDNCQVSDLVEINYDFSTAPHQYLLLVLGKNTHLNYLEKLNASQDKSNKTFTVEIILEENAHLHYIALDQLQGQAASYIRRHSQVGTNSSILWSIGSFNNTWTITDIDNQLEGQASHANLSVLAIVDGQTKQILDSKIHNKGPHSMGHINQHGATLDHGTLTMNGIGRIAKHAKQADAQQENRLIMLSDHARGDANPILLIDEFEVTAGHAASVAKVDENQLWYLMSRGIHRSEAEYLVIRGFLMQAVNQLKNAKARDILLEAVDEKLMTLRMTKND
ncbi:SufB/SufD family protein [Facklamia lactis]|uniref:SufB/SufD family protein n=1 Tax=Facklamia lactis TaxID=2749967 RepID=UPI001F39D77C|nr:SufD family Fe-S cluster assembly protein [Facklamia lactis]